jgi:Domain of unknown function (DUF4404)
MDLHVRETLEDLARRLHLLGEDPPAAAELHGEVQEALDADDEPHGLAERLTEAQINFEADHPSLASALRQAADALSGGGL